MRKWSQQLKYARESLIIAVQARRRRRWCSNFSGIFRSLLSLSLRISGMVTRRHDKFPLSSAAARIYSIRICEFVGEEGRAGEKREHLVVHSFARYANQQESFLRFLLENSLSSLALLLLLHDGAVCSFVIGIGRDKCARCVLSSLF